MILLIGHRKDPVIRLLSKVLNEGSQASVLFDASTGLCEQVRNTVTSAGSRWSIVGGECTGKRPVSAVFARHGRSVSASRRVSERHLWLKLSRMLLDANCLVMNRPSAVTGNYAKVHQLQQLGAAGFKVPYTLVTSIPLTAMQYVYQLGGRVLTKGLSSARTIPKVFSADQLARLGGLLECPLQLQEIVEGKEWRVTIVHRSAVASSLLPNGRYGHFKASDVLPNDLIDRCVSFVDRQGLVIGGYDICQTPTGVSYVFEMNPNPMISHYDSPDCLTLTRTVANALKAASVGPSEIFV